MIPCLSGKSQLRQDQTLSSVWPCRFPLTGPSHGCVSQITPARMHPPISKPTMMAFQVNPTSSSSGGLIGMPHRYAAGNLVHSPARGRLFNEQHTPSYERIWSLDRSLELTAIQPCQPTIGSARSNSTVSCSNPQARQRGGTYSRNGHRPALSTGARGSPRAAGQVRHHRWRTRGK